MIETGDRPCTVEEQKMLQNVLSQIPCLFLPETAKCVILLKKSIVCDCKEKLGTVLTTEHKQETGIWW